MRELAPAAAWRCDQIASPCCSFYARVVAATFPRVRSRELALFAPQPQYHPKRGWLISSDQLNIIREPLCHGVKPTGLPRFTLRAVKDACPGQADLVHATNVQSSSSQSKVALRLWPTGQLAPRALYRALSGRRSVARAAVFVVNTTQSRGQTCDALSSAPKWRCLAESALKNPASTANKRRDTFGKRVSTFLTPSCNASVSLLAVSRV